MIDERQAALTLPQMRSEVFEAVCETWDRVHREAEEWPEGYRSVTGEQIKDADYLLKEARRILQGGTKDECFLLLNALTFFIRNLTFNSDSWVRTAKSKMNAMQPRTRNVEQRENVQAEGRRLLRNGKSASEITSLIVRQSGMPTRPTVQAALREADLIPPARARSTKQKKES